MGVNSSSSFHSMWIYFYYKSNCLQSLTTRVQVQPILASANFGSLENICANAGLVMMQNLIFLLMLVWKIQQNKLSKYCPYLARLKLARLFDTFQIFLLYIKLPSSLYFYRRSSKLSFTFFDIGETYKVTSKLKNDICLNSQ